MDKNAQMDDPLKTIELAQDRLQVYTRIRSMLTAEDGPRAIETVDTHFKRWSERLSEAQRRLSESAE
jgi:hypothetical protein